MNYGCIGEHLPHSFSKIIHEKIESYDYCLRELTPDEVGPFLQKADFCGINVTIPYKQTVIPYLDSIDEMAKAIGAVNTVVNRNGALYGYNTDFGGLSALIARIGLSLPGKKVLIIGTGGTAKTAHAVAEAKGARGVLHISPFDEPGAISYDEAYEKHADTEIVINTSPCGMYPKLDGYPADQNGIPFSLERFSALEGVVDVVYNPLRTRLVLDARKRGLRAECGLYMLVAQAVFAAEHFTGKTYETALIDRVFNEIASQKENIVLIGMPGSGKTTVGKELAALTGRRLVDTDAEIVKTAGMPISEIFEKQGERAFRDIESRVIKALAPEQGLVLATGGGAILREENRDALRHNGRLYFLDRPLVELLPTADRPLASTREAITRRYEERYALYTAAADEVVKAGGGVKNTAQFIRKKHENR